MRNLSAISLAFSVVASAYSLKAFTKAVCAFGYPDILSPEEAAEALRIGENAIYELLNSKKLSAYKNGRNWLIPKEAVRKYVVEQSKLE